MPHESFHYRSLEELKTRAAELNITLPFSEDTEVLKQPLTVQGLRLANRLGIAPMEGADSLPDGTPSERTERRYLSYARGGAALIWFEAVSIVPESRSSATQLQIGDGNLDAYRRLTDRIRETGIRENGYAPVLVMQANHSGRYSNPENRPAPLIACRNPFLEQFRPAADSDIVSDDDLERLEERFGKAAQWARTAGFDAMDVKACHGYLLAELLSAFTRPGRYGGSYENRTRLLRNGIRAAKAFETGNFRITVRLGLYDGYPWPYGFGAGKTPETTPDDSEPLRLIRELYDQEGIRFMNLTMGNPYATTHVTRPYDRGMYVPDEHPLIGVARMADGIRRAKQAVPEMTVFGSAPTYLRQYADLYTAGMVSRGYCDGMLFGRMAFADPGFASQILKSGRIDPRGVCLTCGKCGDLIRAHQPTGCVVRNPEYLSVYRRWMEQASQRPANFRG